VRSRSGVHRPVGGRGRWRLRDAVVTLGGERNDAAFLQAGGAAQRSYSLSPPLWIDLALRPLAHALTRRVAPASAPAPCVLGGALAAPLPPAASQAMRVRRRATECGGWAGLFVRAGYDDT
jgi:hypothetical protein